MTTAIQSAPALPTPSASEGKQGAASSKGATSFATFLSDSQESAGTKQAPAAPDAKNQTDNDRGTKPAGKPKSSKAENLVGDLAPCSITNKDGIAALLAVPAPVQEATVANEAADPAGSYSAEPPKTPGVEPSGRGDVARTVMVDRRPPGPVEPSLVPYVRSVLPNVAASVGEAASGPAQSADNDVTKIVQRDCADVSRVPDPSAIAGGVVPGETAAIPGLPPEVNATRSKGLDHVIVTQRPSGPNSQSERKKIDTHVPADSALARAAIGKPTSVEKPTAEQADPVAPNKPGGSPAITASKNDSGEISANPSAEILAGSPFVKIVASSEGNDDSLPKGASGHETTASIKEGQKNKISAHFISSGETNGVSLSRAPSVTPTVSNRFAEPSQQAVPQATPSPTPNTPTVESPLPGGRGEQKPEANVRTADSPSMCAASTESVHEARILSRPEQSEMHIGLQTTAFGNVVVHAVVRDSQVGVTIGAEHGDLRHILANDVLAISGQLRQHDLHLEAIRFLDQAPSFDAGSSGADPRGRSFTYSRTNAASGLPFRESVPMTDPESLPEQRSSLNVRA